MIAITTSYSIFDDFWEVNVMYITEEEIIRRYNTLIDMKLYGYTIRSSVGFELPIGPKLFKKDRELTRSLYAEFAGLLVKAYFSNPVTADELEIFRLCDGTATKFVLDRYNFFCNITPGALGSVMLGFSDFGEYLLGEDFWVDGSSIIVNTAEAVA